MIYARILGVRVKELLLEKTNRSTQLTRLTVLLSFVRWRRCSLVSAVGSGYRNYRSGDQDGIVLRMNVGRGSDSVQKGRENSYGL